MRLHGPSCCCRCHSDAAKQTMIAWFQDGKSTNDQQDGQSCSFALYRWVNPILASDYERKDGDRHKCRLVVNET